MTERRRVHGPNNSMSLAKLISKFKVTFSSVSFNIISVSYVGVNNDSNVAVRRRHRTTEKTPVPDMTVGITGGSAGRRRLSADRAR